MSEQTYITLDLVTLEKTLFQGKVKEIIAPTKSGEIAVLPNHIPLVTALQAGELKLKVNEGEGIYSPDMIFIAISGGFMEVKPDSVVNIIADSALRVDEIDEKKALEAKEKAEQLLREHAAGIARMSDQEFARAAAQIERAAAQLKVFRRKRHK
ncbi:ATP synthase F1 subunit epsilon [Candidatus Peregrinibacteria bacterium]|nr:ATP synthase F1 subunit epsilon [Candidatus Peregrinibacteria bacterium]